MIKYKVKHLISLADLSKSEIESILERADFWSQSGNFRLTHTPKTLDNPVVCNLFFESSTRTRFSFEVATQKLGYHLMNFEPSVSSTQKGESFYDTVKTLEAMGVNIAIVRTKEENLLESIADNINMSLINAGAGADDHPTQGLLDLQTMKQHFGQIEGLKVAIIGDIKYSRVAKANIVGLGKFGAEVLVSGPGHVLPDQSSLPAHVSVTDIDSAVAQADVVMMLRVQKERHQEITIDETYLDTYGLNKKRYALMQDHAVIMHPAPFNRDVEIDSDIVEDKRSLIFKQVTNGVAVRMAVLERSLPQFSERP